MADQIYNTSMPLQKANDNKSDLHKDTKEQQLKDLIEELQLQVDQTQEQDKNELYKILVQILNYPKDDLAQIHSQAMQLGNYDLQQETQEPAVQSQSSESSESSKSSKFPKFCECCGFKRHKKRIKICTSIDNIKNIGTSTTLYFATFKHLSILLIILTLVYSVFALTTNILAAKNSSLNNSYTLDYLTISLSSKESNPTDQNKLYYYIQCWLGMAVAIIWIIIFILIRLRQFKEAKEYDNDTNSISDYSISLKGVPIDLTEQELKASFDNHFKFTKNIKNTSQNQQDPLKIVKFNIAKPFYMVQEQLRNKERDKFEEIEQINKKIEDYKETLRQWVLERQSRSTFSEPDETREQLFENLEKQENKLKNAGNKLLEALKQKGGDQLTTAYVTFQTNIPRNILLEQNDFSLIEKIKMICREENKFQIIRTNGNKVWTPQIQRAPEPEDIIWANIGLRDCNTSMRKIVTYIATAILLAGSFMVVYGLAKAQQEKYNDRAISFAISIVIAVVNMALGAVIKLLTIFEKDYTSTNRQASLAIKSIVAQMINSILTPVITAYYIKTDTKVYQTGGLVDNIFIMSFTNALVPPILLLFDPFNLLTKIIRIVKSTAKSKLYSNQKKHNILYEGVEFEVGYAYIYLVNVFIFTCFFVSLQPIVPIVALFGYLIMFWVQKYCMFYRYKRPVPSTDFVNKAVYQVIFLGPLIYSLGSLTWANFDPDGNPKEAILPNILAVVFSSLIFIVPINPIILACLKSDNPVHLTKYQEKRLQFSTQYDRLNPVTASKAIKDFNNFAKEELSKKTPKQVLQFTKRMRIGQQREALACSSILGLAASQHNQIQAILSSALKSSFLPIIQELANVPQQNVPVLLTIINNKYSQYPQFRYSGGNEIYNQENER